MSIIRRHPLAPYRPGETVDGTNDVEHDIAAFVDQFNNAKIDDANIKSGANITASSVATGAITSDKIITKSVDTSKMSKVAYFTSDTTADLATNSNTFVDVPSISSITVTPWDTTDLVIATFTAMIHASSGSYSSFVFSFDIGGSPLDGLALLHIDPVSTATVTYSWAQAAGVASPTTLAIKPIYLARKGTDGQFRGGALGGAPDVTNKIFSVYLVSS